MSEFQIICIYYKIKFKFIIFKNELHNYSFYCFCCMFNCCLCTNYMYIMSYYRTDTKCCEGFINYWS